jgi:hypothetical protein
MEKAKEMGSKQSSPRKNPPAVLASSSATKASVEIYVLNDTVWISCADPRSHMVQHVGCSLHDDRRLRELLIRDGILADMRPQGEYAATWFCREAIHWPPFAIWHPDGRLLFKPRAALGELRAFRAKLESICEEDPGKKRTLIYVLSDLENGIKLVGKSVESLATLSSHREGSARIKRSQRRGQWFRKPESLAYALYRLFEDQSRKPISHSARCDRIARFQRQYLRREFSHTRQTIENQIKSFERKTHLKGPLETLIDLLLTNRWKD